MTQGSDVIGAGRYVALLRAPHVGALLGWGMVARLPLGMTPLALLLVVRGQGGSYAAAGAVAAAYAIALGAGAPIAGRQVDRHGQAHVLVPRAIVHPCLLAAVGALALVGVPTIALAAAAAAAGATSPPVASSVRTLLPSLVPTELRATGFALEASLQEVFFVGGPLFVALLAAIHPVAALAGAAVAVALGTLALVRVPPVRDTRPDHAPGHVRSGALTAVGVRTILVLASFMGLSFGTVEVAIPAFAEQHGSRALAGLALASFSAGSLLGGLLAGLRPAREAAVMSGAMGSPARNRRPHIAGIDVAKSGSASPTGRSHANTISWRRVDRDGRDGRSRWRYGRRRLAGRRPRRAVGDHLRGRDDRGRRGRCHSPPTFAR